MKLLTFQYKNYLHSSRFVRQQLSFNKEREVEILSKYHLKYI